MVKVPDMIIAATKRNFICAAFIFLALISPGCAPLIIGSAAGAAGAYAASRDTIEGDTDKSYKGLWKSAAALADNYGTIKQQDDRKGYIEVKSAMGSVSIRIVRLTQHANRVKVSARNTYHLPDLAEAQRIYTRIIDGA
jgi:hypothetical protein